MDMYLVLWMWLCTSNAGILSHWREKEGSCKLTSCSPTEQFPQVKTETGCALTLILVGSGLSEKEENT